MNITMTCPGCTGQKQIRHSLPDPPQLAEARIKNAEARREAQAAFDKLFHGNPFGWGSPEDEALRTADARASQKERESYQTLQSALGDFPNPSYSELCTQCDGTGVALLSVDPGAALSYLLGRVIDMERRDAGGDPSVYRKYFDALAICAGSTDSTTDQQKGE